MDELLGDVRGKPPLPGLDADQGPPRQLHQTPGPSRLPRPLLPHRYPPPLPSPTWGIVAGHRLRVGRVGELGLVQRELWQGRLPHALPAQGGAGSQRGRPLRGWQQPGGALRRHDLRRFPAQTPVWLPNAEGWVLDCSSKARAGDSSRAAHCRH